MAAGLGGPPAAGAAPGSPGNEPICRFLDEVQNLRDWAPQLEHPVDLQPVRAMVTGSPGMRIEAGRDGLDAAPHLTDLAGRVAESVVGQFFKSIVDRDVAHFPERGAGPEVDDVLTIGEQRVPMEVK